MGRYLLRRLSMFIPTLFVMALVVFFMIDLVPGDPVVLILGLEASGEAMDDLRAELGLNRPIHERLVQWLAGLFRGDLGDSIFLRESVSTLIRERLTVTISMTLLSLLIAVIVGVPLGIIASINQGNFVDWAVMVLSLLVLSVPTFWLALNLIYLFGVNLRWLPIGGYVPISESPREFFRHMILPCGYLGLAQAAIIARMTRTSMLEVLKMDYVRTARAKGLRQWSVICAHAFRNALVPVVTVVGFVVGALLGGSPITETVYNLPGVGRMIAEAVQRRDYSVVQGGILCLTLVYLVVNLLVDVAYAFLDPRIRYE